MSKWSLVFKLHSGNDTYFPLNFVSRQKWFDDRLAFANQISPGMRDKIKYLTITEPGKVMPFFFGFRVVQTQFQVWMPDTFFRNERFGRMHNVLVPNLYVRIYADGTVLFRLLLIVSLFCSNFFFFSSFTCFYLPVFGSRWPSRARWTLSCTRWTGRPAPCR